MAITLVGTTSGAQGLFNRLGKLIKLGTLLDTHRVTTLPGAIEAAIALFDGSTAAVRDTADELLPLLNDLIDGNSPAGIQAIAEAVLIQMINADNPRPDLSVDEALAELIKQVEAAAYYVGTNTISTSVSQSNLDGNGVVIASTLDARGQTMENLVAEDLEIRSDGTSLTVLGEPAVERFSQLWPRGSGSRANLPLIQADGSGNLITNGSFDAWTASVPDGWTIPTGSATVAEETSTVYKSGGSAVKITSDGSTLTHLRFDVTELLEPLTVYAVNAFMRVNATASAGTGGMRLHDGTGLVNDEAGNGNGFNIDLTALTTSYAARNGFFRTPAVLPATVYLDVVITVALQNTRIWYIDHLSLAEAERPSGDAKTPYLIAFEGSTPFSAEDGRPSGPSTFKVAVSNNKAGKWQQGMERLFNMSSRDLQLRTAASGTLINESLLS